MISDKDLKQIKFDPFLIYFLENPSEEIIQEAIKENPITINLFRKLPRKFHILAIEIILKKPCAFDNRCKFCRFNRAANCNIQNQFINLTHFSRKLKLKELLNEPDNYVKGFKTVSYIHYTRIKTGMY